MCVSQNQMEDLKAQLEAARTGSSDKEFRAKQEEWAMIKVHLEDRLQQEQVRLCVLAQW